MKEQGASYVCFIQQNTCFNTNFFSQSNDIKPHVKDRTTAELNDNDKNTATTNHLSENGVSVNEEGGAGQNLLLPAAQEAMASLRILETERESPEEDGCITPSGTLERSNFSDPFR